VRPGDRTIETGTGVSTVVFTAAGAHHTAVSPNADEHERIRAYCRTIGIDDTGLSFAAGFSEEVLPKIAAPDSFDVAFIDGAHSFPFPAVDWHYIASSLRVGGKMILDDIPIPAVAQVFKFMDDEPNWQLDRILDDRAALFTLTAVAPPENWVLQKSQSHPDYGFAPPVKRIRLEADWRLSTWRKAAARRYPRVRDTWKRISKSSTAD
jgi:hypothetical protein